MTMRLSPPYLVSSVLHIALVVSAQSHLLLVPINGLDDVGLSLQALSLGWLAGFYRAVLRMVIAPALLFRAA
jgi:hypothetical protein